MVGYQKLCKPIRYVPVLSIWPFNSKAGLEEKVKSLLGAHKTFGPILFDAGTP
jgi:hypothetical protein